MKDQIFANCYLERVHGVSQPCDVPLDIYPLRQIKIFTYGQTYLRGGPKLGAHGTVRPVARTSQLLTLEPSPDLHNRRDQGEVVQNGPSMDDVRFLRTGMAQRRCVAQSGDLFSWKKNLRPVDTALLRLVIGQAHSKRAENERPSEFARVLSLTPWLTNVP